VLAAPAALAAQAAPAAPAAPAAAPTVEIGQFAGGLKAGTWTWNARLNANGQTQDFGTRTVTLQKSKQADEWMLLDAQTNSMMSMSDTLVLSAGDLGPVRRALKIDSPMGAMNLGLTYTADSVKGAVQAPGQSQTIAAKNVKGALSNDAVLLMTLGRLPLAAGWSGRLDLLNPATGATVPLTLRVSGNEKVTVPAGTFDTWVVEMAGGPTPVSFYVAKDGPVVRTVQSVPQMGGTMEAVLAK
ncbi:hypothetical protein PYV61_20965, partial [Roseisolibacter sp. H3M3-2]